MSQVLQTLAPFREINKAFPCAEPIREWKEKGGKVIGFFGGDIPEEILSAIGVLPIWLRGPENEIPLDTANSYLNIYTCSLTRSLMETALKGDFNYLDGVISTPYCDGTRRLIDNWEKYLPVPVIHFLHTPHKNNEEALEYYHQNILEFVAVLERTFQKKLTTDSLREAIATYNHTRRLFQRLYSLRKKDHPPVSGAEVMELYNASAMISRKDFNVLLEALVKEAETTDRAVPGDLRLMISGTTLHNSEYVKGIEDLGCVVVMDVLLNGSMNYLDLIEEDEEPLRAIVRYYLGRFPSPRMHPTDVRFRRVLELAKEYRIDGVIAGVVRYCAPHIYDEVRLSKRLEDQGTPALRLDLEYGLAATGQIKTRVQAFMEMIEEKRSEA